MLADRGCPLRRLDCGGCGIGVNTDQQAVPDPEVFRACLEDGMAQVLAVA
jgi:hypothetical protein